MALCEFEGKRTSIGASSFIPTLGQITRTLAEVGGHYRKMV